MTYLVLGYTFSQHSIPHCEEKAGHRLAKTGQKNRKYEGEGATSKARSGTNQGMGRWGVHPVGGQIVPRRSGEFFFGFTPENNWNIDFNGGMKHGDLPSPGGTGLLGDDGRVIGDEQIQDLRRSQHRSRGRVRLIGAMNR